MRRKWCRRRLDMLSIRPRQRAGEKGLMFKLVTSSCSEVHCETCKGIRIPESTNFLLVESGILGLGIRNPALRIQNPT